MSASDGPTLTRNGSSRRFGHHNNELQLHLLVGLALLVGLLLPSIFAPFVLSGVMLPSLPSKIIFTVEGALVLGFAGGSVVGTIASQELAVAQSAAACSPPPASSTPPSGSTPLSMHSLDGWRAARGDGGVLAACLRRSSRIAPPSHNPAVHLLHYVAATIALVATAPRRRRSRGDAERNGGVDWLLPPRGGGWAAAAAFAVVDATEYAWWFLGLSWPLIRLGMATAALGTIASQYALTDREHHVVASPLALALLLRAVTISTIELIPVAPIIGLRAWANLLCGRAALDSLHANGVAGLLLRPLAFFRSASLRRACARALTYEAWQGARRDLDEHEGGAAWQRCHVSPFYDVRLVTTALETLRRVEAAAVASGDPSQLAELVVTLCNRSLASLDDPNNFRFPGIGAPAAVVALLQAMEAAIERICGTEWHGGGGGRGFGAAQKRAFVAAALHAHGRTALCLSGGGALALYHLGAVDELLRRGLLPEVISGTSGGAIIAGLLACRTDDELSTFIRGGELERVVATYPFFDDPLTSLRRLLSEGYAVEKTRFMAALHPLCGDLSFEEAFQRTGRLVSLSTSTVSLGSTLLLNHVVTPSVLVRSAIQASCALPGVMGPSTLLAKDASGNIVPFESGGLVFRDGSFQDDIPLKPLTQQFHCSRFVVSQANPHVVPFLDDPVAPCSPLYRLQRFLTNHVRSRLLRYAQASRLPSEVASIVNQNYCGGEKDVTCFPGLRFGDMTFRIFTMPSVSHLHVTMARGRQMVFPHLRRVAHLRQLESALERAADALAADAADRGARRTTSTGGTPIDRAPPPAWRHRLGVATTGGGKPPTTGAASPPRAMLPPLEPPGPAPQPRARPSPRRRRRRVTPSRAIGGNSCGEAPTRARRRWWRARRSPPRRRPPPGASQYRIQTYFILV